MSMMDRCQTCRRYRKGLWCIECKYEPKDLVDVIRCRECKWWDAGENESDSWHLCTRHFGKYINMSDDDYCSMAERKEQTCETCKHDNEEWYSEACDGCTKADSNYERKEQNDE